jgi:hypothetical protein
LAVAIGGAGGSRTKPLRRTAEALLRGRTETSGVLAPVRVVATWLAELSGLTEATLLLTETAGLAEATTDRPGVVSGAGRRGVGNGWLRLRNRRHELCRLRTRGVATTRGWVDHLRRVRVTLAFTAGPRRLHDLGRLGRLAEWGLAG